jgi:hypothetical protein
VVYLYPGRPWGVVGEDLGDPTGCVDDNVRFADT